MTTQRIVIRKHNHFIDVFFGEEGFYEDSWCRFYLKNNYLKMIDGVALSQDDFKFVKKELGL